MNILYQQATSSVELCYEVKKSKFITRIHPITNKEDALQYLHKAKQDYPDARHHCWAYLLGAPSQPQTQAFNDDGEPSGTAGKPILNVLNHGVVGDVMVIVIRYFGGIKLGAGGLVRAYSSSTQEAMNILPTKAKIAVFTAQLEMNFSLENKCRHFLKNHHGDVLQQDFSDVLQLKVELPTTEKQNLEGFCQRLSIKISNTDH